MARPAIPIRLPIALASVLAAATVGAEENRFNLHLAAGPLFNLQQPAHANPEEERVTTGLHLRLTFEFQASEWLGFEAGWGPNLLFARFGDGTLAQQNLVAGVRVHPWWNRRGGYLMPRPAHEKLRRADLLSDVWIDAHAGAVLGNGSRVAWDVGVGARVAVFSPFQVGLFVRFMQLFAVDNSEDSPTYKQLIVGLMVSAGFKPARSEPDRDHDGVPDARDKCPATPRGAKVNAVGCELQKESAPPRCSDTDLDGVCDGSDECPDTPLGTQVDKSGCPVDAPRPPEDAPPPPEGAPPPPQE